MCVYQYIWRFPFYPMSKWNQTGDMISNPYNSFHWKKVANHVSHRSYYRIPNKSIPSKKTTKCVMFVLHLFMVNTLNYPIFSALYIPVISQKNRTKTTMCASEIPMNPTKSQWNPMKSHVFVSTPCFHGTHPMFHHRRFSWWLDLLAPCWVVSCSKSWATCRGECSNELEEGRCVASAIFLDRLFHVCYG